MPIDWKLHLLEGVIMEIDMLDNASNGTVIKVVGVGGAGGNAVQHMINKGVCGVEFIAANTDAQALKQSRAHNIIQIGETGLGAGMQPAVGRQLAEDSRARIDAVAGIAQTINAPGHINVDSNDVKTIMGEQGKAMMGSATASGVDRARIAAEQAVASPLLDGIDLSGARGVLVNVTASRNLKGKEIKEVMATVRAFAAPDASIAQGIAYDDEMGDDIRVTVVATGLGRARKTVQLVQTPVLRTGTHNEPMMSNAAMAAGNGHAASSFEGLKAPAVWRRVSASETVRALDLYGMDSYDIPAFLRKQAD